MTIQEISALNCDTNERLQILLKEIENDNIVLSSVERGMVDIWKNRTVNHFPGDIVHDITFSRRLLGQKFCWIWVSCGSYTCTSDFLNKLPIAQDEILASFILSVDENGFINGIEVNKQYSGNK